MPKVVITPDVLLNQLRRDAPLIADTFDKLCGRDLEEISSLLAEGSTIVLGGMFGAAQDHLRLWSAEVLVNIADTLSAAVYVLRAGYRLVPGLILRNAIEAMSVCLHGLQRPKDLPKIKSGKFDSTVAIGTAKKVIPPFGRMHGYLSEKFVHIGPLHHSIQPITPFTDREPDLIVNLSAIRASVWMFYVVAEFAFLDSVPKTRYWRLDPPNKAIFEPSKEVVEWQERFLLGPDARKNSKKD